MHRRRRRLDHPRRPLNHSSSFAAIPTSVRGPFYSPSEMLSTLVNMPVGPIVVSDTARSEELDISLLERLFARPLYADHVHARSRMHNRNAALGSPSMAPFTNLVKVCDFEMLCFCFGAEDVPYG
jgi:hypothetical protein